MPSRWERLKNDQRVLAALFLLPALLVLVSVVVYPFADAVWISFQAKQAGTPGRFIGVQNYGELLGNRADQRQSLMNSAATRADAARADPRCESSPAATPRRG